ncbi:hypothetical protein GW17_00051114 [Ensete ventricosum]|nr:hypothetical protein GW17_00051114 [Ensete ventricosum]
MVWSSPGGGGRRVWLGPHPPVGFTSTALYLSRFDEDESAHHPLNIRAGESPMLSLAVERTLPLKPAAGPAVPPSAAAALSISSLTHRLETYFRSNERGQRMAAAPAAGGDSCEEQRRVGPAGHSAPPLVASRGARRSPPSRRQ